MQKTRIYLYQSLCAILIFSFSEYLPGCNSGETSSDTSEDISDNIILEIPDEDSDYYPKAFATLSPVNDSKMEGTAVFTDQGDGKVTLLLKVAKCAPGDHAVHLHENGDCTADDGSSAGGHWDPENNPHGKRNVDLRHHRGDVANMMVAEDGTGELSMTVLGWSVGGPDSTNILSKAVVIHAGADDFTTQPSGAAGDRIACGVIIGVE